MYRIFIVEDDPAITGVLERHLQSWGYLTQSIQDFQNVLQEFESCQPHLVLMDISLPFFNGYYWCEQIRAKSKTPILFISSAGDDMNQVMALNLGADDFIAKPFHLDVMTAKIQAILRRTYSFGEDPGYLEVEGVRLNLNDTTLWYGDKRIELTKNEFRILQLLMEQRGKPVSRDTIMERLWQTDNFIDDNTLTVNITRVRKKLDSLGVQSFIKTKKGLGYMVR